jgi:hypothetical protein
MDIYVEELLTNDEFEAADEPFMKLAVIFEEKDAEGYHTGCKVTVFIEKDDGLTLGDIKALAVQRAYHILRKITAGAEVS